MVRRRPEENFALAQSWLERPDYDLDDAHLLLAHCLSCDPSQESYAATFLINLERQYVRRGRGDPTPLPRTAPLPVAVERGEWREALKLGLVQLNLQPGSMQALRAVAEAATRLGHRPVAGRFLAFARTIAPDDQDLAGFAERLAHESPKNGGAGPEKAAARGSGPSPWTALLRKGGNPAPLSMEPAYTRRSAPPEPERNVRLNRRQQLQQALRREPTRERYLELAQCLLDEGQFHEAQRILNAAHADFDQDAEILDLREEALLAGMRNQLKLMREQARVEEEASVQSELKALECELRAGELRLAQQRRDRQPNDPQRRLDYAACLGRSGQAREALLELQPLLALPSFAVPALLCAGDCYSVAQRPSKALEAFARACQMLARQPNSRELHRALLGAGRAARALGQTAQAREYLERLALLAPQDAEVRELLNSTSTALS